MHEVSPAFHRSQFQALITLFPECFSSFAHATCSLSVFASYLALRGTQLVIPAPILRYCTPDIEVLCDRYVLAPEIRDGTFTLSGTSFQKTYDTSVSDLTQVRLYHNSWQQLDPVARFQYELVHFHSPLHMKSLLLSFPRLNDMLKFSRYSRGFQVSDTSHPRITCVGYCHCFS